MPDATAQPNDDYLSKIVVQGGMVRTDTNGKSGPELCPCPGRFKEERKEGRRKSCQGIPRTGLFRSVLIKRP